jgi:hypothetical protein
VLQGGSWLLARRSRSQPSANYVASTGRSWQAFVSMLITPLGVGAGWCRYWPVQQAGSTIKQPGTNKTWRCNVGDMRTVQLLGFHADFQSSFSILKYLIFCFLLCLHKSKIRIQLLNFSTKFNFGFQYFGAIASGRSNAWWGCMVLLTHPKSSNYINVHILDDSWLGIVQRMSVSESISNSCRTNMLKKDQLTIIDLNGRGLVGLSISVSQNQLRW